MKKIKVGFAILWGIGLLILFLAASTNLIIDDRVTEVYQISVIWDSDTEDYVQDYKNNIDRYGDIRNIEYRYCNLTTPYDAAQQVRLVKQEEEAGADLVVVKPVEDQDLASALEAEKIRIPVICIDGRVESELVCINIRTDEERRAKALTEVIREQNPEAVIWILDDGKNISQNKRYIKGMEEAGSQLEMETQVIRYVDSESFKKKVSQGENVFVALNPQSLKQAADFLKTEKKEGISLYGFGYTEEILSLMEKNQIRAINASSNFSMGWMAIQYGFKILDGEYYERERILPDETIKAEEMFDPTYEDLLFSIN